MVIDETGQSHVSTSPLAGAAQGGEEEEHGIAATGSDATACRWREPGDLYGWRQLRSMDGALRESPAGFLRGPPHSLPRLGECARRHSHYCTARRGDVSLGR